MIGASNARRTTPRGFDYARLPFLGGVEVEQVLKKIQTKTYWGTVFLHLGANSLFPSRKFWQGGILHTHRSLREPAEITTDGYVRILEALTGKAREVWIVPFYYRLHRKTCHCAEAISYTVQYQDLIRTSLEADLKARLSNSFSLPIHFLSFNSYTSLLLGPHLRADVGICLDMDLVHLNHHAAELVRGWTTHTARMGQN